MANAPAPAPEAVVAPGPGEASTPLGDSEGGWSPATAAAEVVEVSADDATAVVVVADAVVLVEEVADDAAGDAVCLGNSVADVAVFDVCAEAGCCCSCFCCCSCSRCRRVVTPVPLLTISGSPGFDEFAPSFA